MTNLMLFIFFSVSFRTFSCQNETFQGLTFLFINGETTDQFENIQLNETENLLNHPDFQHNRPTMLYCYGYTEKYVSGSTQTVVASYIERGDHNILVVNWEEYSGGNYYNAVRNAHEVGDIVGKTLLKMEEEGFNLRSLHLVGHSLGGHLVGFIGRSVIEHSEGDKKVTRISSLDPARPFFYGPVGLIMMNKPINSEDADFVDVIHTDYNFFGAPESTGTADFWPNEGKEQPECPDTTWDVADESNFCSHRRSWAYYSESVRSKDDDFNAVRCQSWAEFTQGNCEYNGSDPQAFMGYEASPQLKGDYFLLTNGGSPFNRGENGVFY